MKGRRRNGGLIRAPFFYFFNPRKGAPSGTAQGRESNNLQERGKKEEDRRIGFDLAIGRFRFFSFSKGINTLYSLTRMLLPYLWRFPSNFNNSKPLTIIFS